MLTEITMKPNCWIWRKSKDTFSTTSWTSWASICGGTTLRNPSCGYSALHRSSAFQLPAQSRGWQQHRPFWTKITFTFRVLSKRNTIMLVPVVRNYRLFWLALSAHLQSWGSISVNQRPLTIKTLKYRSAKALLTGLGKVRTCLLHFPP